MATNESLVLQALAHNVVRSTESKASLIFNGIPTNDVAEGVICDGDEAGTVRFHFFYPAAHQVVVRTSSDELYLTRTADGMWNGVTQWPVGFHYIFILVDGQDVLSPYVPIGYGYSRPMNYVEVPPAAPTKTGQATVPYLLDPLAPHGSVCSELFFSTVTGRTERLLVYLPPDYHTEACAKTRYPVLYLQHGHGENENAWIFQGKVNIIADNLIHARAARACLIVMGNGMVYRDDKTSALDYCDVLLKDVVPFIEKRFRTVNDADHRAVAGLSMGSMQAARVGIAHANMFAYVGLFSGFLRCSWTTIGGDDSHVNALRENPQSFKQHNRLLFRGIGAEDLHRAAFEEDDRILQELGVDCERVIYPGVHDWQPWRCMIADFLPRLFVSHSLGH